MWRVLPMLVVLGCSRPQTAPSPSPPAAPAAPGVGRAGDAAASGPQDTPSREADVGLSGLWEGNYDRGGAPSAGVAFTAELTIEGTEIRGHIVEPNTFGDGSVSHLHAEVKGTLAPDGTVGFIKTYDGTGSVFHSVEYSGQLDRDRLRITGAWHLGDNEGRFVMQRVRRPAGLV